MFGGAACGAGDALVDTADVWIMTRATPGGPWIWTKVPQALNSAWPAARRAAASSAIDGRWYIFGGMASPTQEYNLWYNDAWEFDCALRVFKVLELVPPAANLPVSLPIRRARAAAALISVPLALDGTTQDTDVLVVSGGTVDGAAFITGTSIVADVWALVIVPDSPGSTASMPRNATWVQLLLDSPAAFRAQHALVATQAEIILTAGYGYLNVLSSMGRSVAYVGDDVLALSIQDDVVVQVQQALDSLFLSASAGGGPPSNADAGATPGWKLVVAAPPPLQELASGSQNVTSSPGTQTSSAAAAPVPSSLPPRFGLAMVAVGSNILAVGGRFEQTYSDVWALDTSATPRQTLPADVFQHTLSKPHKLATAALLLLAISVISCCYMMLGLALRDCTLRCARFCVQRCVRRDADRLGVDAVLRGAGTLDAATLQRIENEMARNIEMTRRGTPEYIIANLPLVRFVKAASNSSDGGNAPATPSTSAGASGATSAPDAGGAASSAEGAGQWRGFRQYISAVLGGRDIGTVDTELAGPACSVCLVDFEHNDMLCRLPCMHVFHKDCVHKWLRNSSKLCPLCKHNVMEPFTGMPVSGDEGEHAVPVTVAVPRGGATTRTDTGGNRLRSWLGL